MQNIEEDGQFLSLQVLQKIIFLQSLVLVCLLVLVDDGDFFFFKYKGNPTMISLEMISFPQDFMITFHVFAVF